MGKVYLDENGNPIPEAQGTGKVYLDDNGNAIPAKPTDPMQQTIQDFRASRADIERAKYGNTQDVAHPERTGDPLRFNPTNPGAVQVGKGLLRGARSVVSMPVDAVKAVVTPPDATEVGAAAQGPAGLATHRLVIAPIIDAHEKMKQAAERGDSVGVLQHAAGMIPLVGGLIDNFIGGVREGDPGAAAELIPQVAAPKAIQGVVGGATKAAAKVASIPDAVSERFAGNQAKVYPEAAKLPIKAQAGAEDIFRASAPTGMNKGFRSNVYAAAGDLADIGRKIDLAETKGGIINPDMRVKATVEAIRDHLDEMYNTERAPQIQRNAAKPVRVGTNPNASRGLEYVEATAGDLADSQLARKALDGGTLTVAEADRLAQTVNQTLKSFEKATPEGKMQLQTTNPKIGGLKALDSELGFNLNKALTDSGETGLRGYERRYAALSAIRDQLESRVNAVELHQPGMIKAVIEPVARLASGGKTGLASASQAATADVNIGRRLQWGFKKLVDSGIKADRPANLQGGN